MGTTATVRVPPIAPEEGALPSLRVKVGVALAGVVAAGAALRFATLGIQSYHHDEVVTVARVIPGSFGHMLHEVRMSESNPPLYYMLAWAWAKAFGTGEVGMRSLTALFGVATIPVAYLAGGQLSGRRTGLVAAALVAVNPMLIWYSQEARSYALLVFFGTLALLFFLRALRTGAGRDLALWALASALALCSHYFAVFPAAIEAAWLLVALRGRWRAMLPAVGAVAAAGLSLLPLLIAQNNPRHIGWIEEGLVTSRIFQTGVSFLAGETGHVIAEPTRGRYALIPAVLIGASLLLLLVRGSRREWRAAAMVASIGVGVVLLALLAALTGHDYIVERNLLPALVPLALAVAVALTVSRSRQLGAVLAVVLCAYWVAFDAYVAATPNLQRPDFREVATALNGPARPRAVVSWKLAADPIRYYLGKGARRIWAGAVPIREIDVASKPLAGRKTRAPAGFHTAARVRLQRLTLLRYVSNGNRLRKVSFRRIEGLPTGFGQDGVVVDGVAGPLQGRR